MTPNPICVSKEMGLKEVSALMVKHSVRHLIVTDKGKIVGIVSGHDIEKFDFLNNAGSSIGHVTDTIKVENFMTKGVHTLYEDETLKDAAEMLTLGAFHALPVIDFEDRVLGIVSSTDLILYLLKFIKEQ